MTVKFFQKLYMEEVAIRPVYLICRRFPKLDSLDFSNLLLDVTNDEIWVALHNMQPWKAHGVDGLYVGFCQTKWQVVGPIVC